MSRKYLLTFTFAAVLSGKGYACSSCMETTQYGAELVKEVASKTSDVASMAAETSSGFASVNQQLNLTGGDIIAAFQALGSSIEMEMKRSTELTTSIIQAQVAADERLMRSLLIAENNVEVAKNYGAANIPSSACRGYKNAKLRQEAKKVAATLFNNFTKNQLKARREIDGKPEINGLADIPVSLSSNKYDEISAQVALSRLSYISGEKSFKVSPDEMMAIAVLQPVGASHEAVNSYAAWVRAAIVSSDGAKQVAKRTAPAPTEENPDPKSLIGELWSETEKSNDISTIVELSKSSELKLLRTIAREGALGNKISMERLGLLLASNRAKSGQIGFAAQAASTVSEGSLDYLKEQDAIEN